MPVSQTAWEPHRHEVIIIGAGVSGIYQIKRLTDLGIDAVVLEGDDDLGGTWYRNRYPGARFDSESYTYGYSWSREVLDEWSWKERFSGQPENLRYLNFVADKFDLRRHMRFDARVSSMDWDNDAREWTIKLDSGAVYISRFVIPSLGPLSMPTLPSYPGMGDFTGPSFHTYHWPEEPVSLEGKRVGVIGTGATGIQVIGELADKVGELKVFQRRPNWSSPLNNSEISGEEMVEIRNRYDEIFASCAESPGGFEHVPDWRGFSSLTEQERHAHYDFLYTQPGFAILVANFAEIFFDQAANDEISAYIANRIRDRVDDPVLAEKLIPKDHGFGMQRLPLETNYFEAYNRENVHLVDLSEAPIERITMSGIQTTAEHHDLDVIVYATGFDAITGGYDRINIRGIDGLLLGDVWADSPRTFVGVLAHGFPNMFMVAGPQSVSGSTNFPRAIETGVDWVTNLLIHARSGGCTRIEATAEAEQDWVDEVVRAHERMMFRHSKGWFTGYNSNVAGHHEGKIRYQAYFGGAPRYAAKVAELAAAGYPGVTLT
ncbi:MAG: NAD(P)/FAD-dependent oxidoreductase [Acidimicrobiaceae bacterium]|jgi:cation diffusion facilitator CzcD-associated flavoprotein CzcO|nr:NAD(P)/FAD-dependent oxidoreductase [Acidimicrobiaceae bacterium]MBT5582358.1 NAD(P)/FAD-dependent oxidoreductase [Acidimicrobiaceae bacterium]MBT5850268.1 NAD(P)/FAD-dependent oxidoreductase [Acidimicrobiaceae bacterium]